MRVWVFDRLGGIASKQIDINKEPVRFSQVILGFLWMSEEDVGFDPTIKGPDGQQVIEIERNGKSECIWPEHDEEGEMLLRADRQKAINVARYYHHDTVRVRGMNDDARDCIRRGLDITTASNYQQATTDLLWNRPTTTSMRTKRSRSSRETVSQTPSVLPNRVYRRVMVKDYGKPIFEASSRKALLACLEGCIIGHQSLYDKGILHRDISTNNLMINEEPDNPSWSYFLIDLDLAIKTKRKKPSVRDKHSFMHDLESFFWVLFWICINYEASGEQAKPKTIYDAWTMELYRRRCTGKSEGRADCWRRSFHGSTTRCLHGVLQALRQKVFPDGKVQHAPNRELYSEMIEVLREAQEDA
ncbi:hypothetical protein E4U09_001238 [Claviceps aff. purpurea]|uniref:non-specific serine/threonine protein kinase n=1 Tax=Claviceps aff. purpurea TaxID=1967640 RepID=A0A9P7QHG7_9HYPO|nr:hypothetical protein E4U09_001238 [Claviceps aff. purpurea]